MRNLKFFCEKEILGIVGDYYGVDINEVMVNPRRKRELVLVRQVAMYLLVNYTNKTLKSIGWIFGGKDHSTVTYSKQTVSDLKDTDKEFARNLNEIEEKIIAIESQVIGDIDTIDSAIKSYKSQIRNMQSEIRAMQFKVKSIASDIAMLESAKEKAMKSLSVNSGGMLEVA